MINDSNVSRRHAEVWRTSEGVAMRDLQSTNGTFVNGHRISAVSLSPRDDVTDRHAPPADRARLSLLAASTNYAAVVRPLQVLVMVVAVLFFARVLRVASVQARPGRRSREAGAARRVAASSRSSSSSRSIARANASTSTSR